MDLIRYLVGGILPYLAFGVFIGGMAYRIRQWAMLPSPPITLFPVPATGNAGWSIILQEIFLFKSLFRGDRTLWILAWVFHAVLALIVLGHLRVIANVDGVFFWLGMTPENIKAMSGGVGGAAGVVILLATLMLFFRRLTVPRVKEITGNGDYLILILLLAIIFSGNMMRFGGETFDLALSREYFFKLATFSFVADAEVLKNNYFLLHMGLSLLLFICIPFSKLLHMGGIFFTQQLIRKN